MKLARVGELGRERPVLVDAEGALRSLAGHCDGLGCDMLAPDRLAALASLDPADLPLVAGEPRYGIPFTGTRKFIAIGLNYHDHAAESGMPVPSEPVVFMKAISCLAGPNDDVPMPRGSTKMDWEVELGIVIGRHARYVEAADALSHVAGYVLVNDVSERFDQLERGGVWDKGKGHDGFGPVGPWLVTVDELGDASDIDLTLDVNGERRQTGNTRSMIFGVPALVAYVSQFMTLEPGDIITTGTPAGVGAGMRPPQFLRVGDEMRLWAAGLGEQRQRVLPSI